MLQLKKSVVSILSLVKDYLSILWQSSNQNSILIFISRGDMCLGYMMNALWGIPLAILLSILIGILVSGVIIFGTLLWQYILYRFGFKSIQPSASWGDYVRYKNAPHRYRIETRGGEISIDALISSIDETAHSINPIIKFIKDQCFREPGFYLARLPEWLAVIKSLEQLGLVKWLLIKGKRIGVIGVDAFLIQVLRLSSLRLQVPIIGSVSVSISDLSRQKMLFNILGLAAIVFLGSAFFSLSLSYLILNRLGFIVLGGVARKYASSSALWVITAITVYATGQFVPPQCDKLAGYLDHVNLVNGKIKIQIPFLELEMDDNSILIYSPPPITGIEPVDIPVEEMPTLGSLFKVKVRRFANYVARRQVKKFSEFVEELGAEDDFDLSYPATAPIYQCVKEKVGRIFVDD